MSEEKTDTPVTIISTKNEAYQQRSTINIFLKIRDAFTKKGALGANVFGAFKRDRRMDKVKA